jgi:hypothetical protein
MKRTTGSPVLAFCLALAGCGGENGGPPAPRPLMAGPEDPGNSPADCTADAHDDKRVIDDFELGAASGWYTNNEVCYACSQTIGDCDAGAVADGGCAPAAQADCVSRCSAVQSAPSPTADPIPATKIPNGGRCGSQYAIRIQAGPFTDWGGKLGTQFTKPFDASAWDGIAFWARIAPGSEGTARISLSDQHTDTTYNQSLAVPYCNPQTTKTVYKDGCDKYGSYVPMIDNWRYFRIPFSELRQEGWGRQAPTFDVFGILSIELTFKVGSWEFWIDDISFYRKRPG